MISAIISFLGGSAFRMVWGELSSYFSKRQEHQFEIERLQIENQLAADLHARNLESIKLQAEMGIKTIEVRSDADERLESARAFTVAQEALTRQSGIRWVDAWNATIRPGFASVVLILWCLALYRAGWMPTSWDLDLMAGIAGFFFADRSLGRRGK